MTDARRLLVAVRGALLPVPAQPQDGVCTICHSSAPPGRRRCAQCRRASRLEPPEILPLALSVHGGPIHEHLRGYKDSPSPRARDRMSLRLAGLLAVFMQHHAPCLGDWDYVTCVPSASRVALEGVVRRVPRLSGHQRQVLAAHRAGAKRALDHRRIAVTSHVARDRVLLLDDTFVTGATLFSAVAALRSRGAEVVGPVVLGRHLQESWGPSGDLLSWLSRRPWDERRCAWCAGERRDTASLARGHDGGAGAGDARARRVASAA